MTAAQATHPHASQIIVSCLSEQDVQHVLQVLHKGRGIRELQTRIVFCAEGTAAVDEDDEDDDAEGPRNMLLSLKTSSA